jgi:peptidoglycan glycosyltransferase
MERRIRRLGIFIVLCFLALFIQLNNIQVLRSNALANAPGNPRIVNAERSETRGSILSADGVTLASSVLAPPGSIYKYQRVYNPQTANLFSQVTGFAPSIFGNNYGIESEYNSYLTPHTRPAKTLRDLLVNRTEVDNVTLTITNKLQSQVAAAINQDAPGVNGAAAVVLDPTTGAIEAMYSNPSFDPNTLVSQNIKSDEFTWTALNKLQYLANPLVPGTYDQRNAPGSSFKVVTTSAVLEHSPTLTNMIYPSIPSITLPLTGQVLTNDGGEYCPEKGQPGTLEELLIESCDADFAYIGQQLGASTLVGQAEAYGFNGKVPLDVPSDTVATSNFGTVSSFEPDNAAGLMKSAIGQEDVTASALQMAMVAGTVANGGKEMTPHLMEQIRDTQGSLVTSFTPSVWKTPIQPSTAATLTTFMQGVVQKGTAAGVGFPASWNVAAKTGTAQVGSFTANPPFTTDWLIAFAPVGQSKVAIAVVLPHEPGSATGATYSGPIVKQILGDVLADQ